MKTTIDTGTLEKLISIAESYKQFMGDDSTTDVSVLRFCRDAINAGKKALKNSKSKGA